MLPLFQTGRDVSRQSQVLFLPHALVIVFILLSGCDVGGGSTPSIDGTWKGANPQAVDILVISLPKATIYQSPERRDCFELSTNLTLEKDGEGTYVSSAGTTLRIEVQDGGSSLWVKELVDPDGPVDEKPARYTRSNVDPASALCP